jgi:hypothetical protein
MSDGTWLWVQSILWPALYCIGIGCVLWLMGCTTMSERFKIVSPDGTVTEYSSSVRSLGNGPAEFVSAGDGTTGFSTAGKGLSDNGKAALGEIAEGTARAMLPLP